MKPNDLLRRIPALALCAALLLTTIPLPCALAAPEDENDTSVSAETDTGEQDGTGENGKDTAQPGATNSTNVIACLLYPSRCV